LELGIGSIIDCVNGWPETRTMFEFPSARIVRVEIVCQNVSIHRARLDARGIGPSWDSVLARQYERWDEADFRFDTSAKTAKEIAAELSRVVNSAKNDLNL
jgi:chloramphenicol 3-O-phosphotransferase